MSFLQKQGPSKKNELMFVFVAIGQLPMKWILTKVAANLWSRISFWSRAKFFRPHRNLIYTEKIPF